MSNETVIRYTKEHVLDFLDKQGIQYHYKAHEAVYTMEEIERAGIISDGIVFKNLFLRDDKGKNHVLVSVSEAAHIDFKSLNEQVGLKRLGMASAERLEKYLGVEQGSVSPLGVLNDTEHEVLVVMDKNLADDTEVVVHPNDNTMSVWMKYKDLKKLVTGLGNRLILLEFKEEV